MPWVLRERRPPKKLQDNVSRAEFSILRGTGMQSSKLAHVQVSQAVSYIWGYTRNSAAVDVANPLSRIAAQWLNGIMRWLGLIGFPVWELELVFEKAGKDTFCTQAKRGQLPDYEFKDDPEQDARLEAQFARTRKILYVNRVDDVLDDDNTVDGFFGSRIGVFGPDPFAWSFSNEEMARQHVPDLVPDIISFQKSRKLRPFFDAWHDEVLACGDGGDGEEEEDRFSRPPLPTLMSFRGSVQLQRQAGSLSTEERIQSSRFRGDAKTVRDKWRQQITCTGDESAPACVAAALRSHRSLVVDESEALQVVKKHWQLLHFNRASRDLFGLVQAEGAQVGFGPDNRESDSMAKPQDGLAGLIVQSASDSELPVSESLLRACVSDLGGEGRAHKAGWSEGQPGQDEEAPLCIPRKELPRAVLARGSSFRMARECLQTLHSAAKARS